jgi:hypothetical protein
MEERVFEIVGAIEHPTVKDNERRGSILMCS